jgi:FixJ family two-component response regulator
LVAIVDDEPSVLKGLKRLLDAGGFTTKVFRSGEEFLQSEDADHAACVILDIHLGGMSGVETRRALTARGCGAPVIFMTALDTAYTRREALESGCATYLRKPFAGRELFDAIRKATTAH